MVVSSLWRNLGGCLPGFATAFLLCFALSLSAADDASLSSVSYASRQSVLLERSQTWTSILAGQPVAVGGGTAEGVYIIGVTLESAVVSAASSASDDGTGNSRPVLMVRAVLDNGQVAGKAAIPIAAPIENLAASGEAHYSFLLTDASREGCVGAVDIQVRVEYGYDIAVQIGGSTVTVSPIHPAEDLRTNIRF